MYNGIGLQTPRGSGTNGYVQAGKFLVRGRTSKVIVDGNKGFGHDQGTAVISKKLNKDLLEHDCKRKIDLKLVILKGKLSDQGYTDAKFAEKLEEARRNLEAAAAAASDENGGAIGASDKNSPCNLSLHYPLYRTPTTAAGITSWPVLLPLPQGH